MSASLAGRALAGVGVVMGLLAVALDLVSSGGSTARYLDHGAVAAFIIVLLSVASYLPAEVGLDSLAAAAGSAAFGFYLFVPALFAFNELRALGAAAWLGLATVLIPIGWAIVRVLEREPGATAPSAVTGAALLRDPVRAQAFAGLALIVAGIWLPALSGGTTYWDASSSGHALGLLTLLAVGREPRGALPRYRPQRGHGIAGGRRHLRPGRGRTGRVRLRSSRLDRRRRLARSRRRSASDRERRGGAPRCRAPDAGRQDVGGGAVARLLRTRVWRPCRSRSGAAAWSESGRR